MVPRVRPRSVFLKVSRTIQTTGHCRVIQLSIELAIVHQDGVTATVLEPPYIFAMRRRALECLCPARREHHGCARPPGTRSRTRTRAPRRGFYKDSKVISVAAGMALAGGAASGATNWVVALIADFGRGPTATIRTSPIQHHRALARQRALPRGRGVVAGRDDHQTRTPIRSPSRPSIFRRAPPTRRAIRRLPCRRPRRDVFQRRRVTSSGTTRRRPRAALTH